MKKLIIASLLAIALVFLLCSCAGTSESDTQSLVLNPFETSENENSETDVYKRQFSNSAFPLSSTVSVFSFIVRQAVYTVEPAFILPKPKPAYLPCGT